MSASHFLLFQAGFGKVSFGQPDNNTGQAEKGDQIGDRHKAVEGIGNVPNQIQLQGRAHQDHGNEDDLIDLCALAAQQELAAAGAVEGPAENGGQSEENQTDLNNNRLLKQLCR